MRRSLLLLAAVAGALVTSASAQPAPLVVEGGETFSLQGPSAEYSIHVTCPHGYDPDRTESYPVLYYADAWWLTELVVGITRMAELSEGGQIDPVVLVGIGLEGDAEAWNVQRNRDFTPSPFRAPSGVTLRSGGVVLDSAGTGGAPAFLSFLRDELFPRIEADYAVNPDRRGWLGHSFGGLFGAWTLAEAPGLFTDLLLVSPAVWWNGQEVTRQSEFDPGANVFLAHGSAETGPIPRTVPTLADTLRADGVAVEATVYEGRDHTSVLMPAIWDGLVHLYGR